MITYVFQERDDRAKPLRIPQPVPLSVAEIEVAECAAELTLMERTTVVVLNANKRVLKQRLNVMNVHSHKASSSHAHEQRHYITMALS